ncbi:MAG TPA: UDP-N-acetylmuramate dehydrogenase [Candidatus Saccharicenans sp.]|nr:UDP-N-acetylmuramate dehydrogenase [Candidatus Saccharicenans sp.]HQO75356.1 UDP-N-acetylmuramate dehydrogenase [Candidatus Saccharicenans sp.]HUM78627.1 UDP-N-acetylmuramate dehydrogenase [Candidatus Saccharicenans sp.]
MQDFEQFFLAETGLKLKKDVALSDYSSFKIGGLARYFVEVTSSDQLVKAVSAVISCRFPFYLIGGGYNLLFDDAGFNGLIIRNKALAINYLSKRGLLEVDSGSDLQPVVRFAVSKGLKGLEFLAGIPGTVGGAIYGNAGAFGQSIGEKVSEVLIFSRERRFITLKQSELGFGYRFSNLKKDHQVVLKALLALEPGDKSDLEHQIKDYLEQRRRKHPPRSVACAGSYFKNPVLSDGQKVAAGLLLEKSGARGMQVGGAAVYPGHCNFIINLGGATARDIKELARRLQEAVHKNFGLWLEEEVIFVPADASML